MRRFILPALLSALMATGAAMAQYPDRPYGDRDYARRDRALFDRVRMDLDRASKYSYASRGDRKRFDEARRELFDFESRFDQGRYNKHELSEAIDRLDRVVSHNSLDPRDRGALAEDVRRMRDYRAFRDHHGEREFDYGYR
jgi:hypothetical protein